MTSNRIIKRIVTFCIAAVYLARIALGDEIQDVLKRLDSAYMRQDAVALVRLAAELDGKDLWTLAGGGPTDTVSLRMRVFAASTELLFEKGKMNELAAANAEGKLSSPEQKVLSLLNSDYNNWPALRSLLVSDDASERWLGLYKARFLTSPSPVVIQALRKVALSDDWIIISEVPVASLIKPEFRKDFVAPLRSMAREQLLKWRQSTPQDQEDICSVGWRRLSRDYASRIDKREIILEVVGNLRDTSSAKQSLDKLNPVDAQEQDAISAFKKAARLDNNREKHP
jgi:hypothetical protein